MFILYDARLQKWLEFLDPVQIHSTVNVEEITSLLHTVERRVKEEKLYAAGFLSYEAAPAFDPAFQTYPPGDFPLAWFVLFEEAREFEFPKPYLTSELPGLNWQPTVSQSQYQQAFDDIKMYIREGDTYQVNYSFRLRSSYQGESWPLFQRMITAQGAGYGAFIETEDWAVCSASPELFFELSDGHLISKPMKGTAPRGLTLTDDRTRAEELYHSAKNRAENIMIVDMMRNDMNRIALPGTVQVTRFFDIEKYPTLWQMTSTVECRTNSGPAEVLENLFPAASITGAPKIRTMKIIHELENTPRRIYTGSIGFINPQGRAQFNVAIRTVLIDKKRQTAEYGLGGGIVWGSDTQNEFDECYTKARVLLDAPPQFDLLETLLWTPDKGYFLMENHLRRMAESAEFFSRPCEDIKLRQSLQQAAEKFTGIPQRVRLLLRVDGTFVVENQMLSPMPQPFRFGLAVAPVDSSDRFLYHKTTRRIVYEKARAAQPGFDDVLLWNPAGEITETTIANIICVIDGQWLTPPVSCGLLPGLYRAEMLKQGNIREAEIRVEDLNRCTKYYLINSVRGLWPVQFENSKL